MGMKSLNCGLFSLMIGMIKISRMAIVIEFILMARIDSLLLEVPWGILD